MIIGIGYKKRSGKDTIGEHLIDAHDFQRAAFADKLKEVTAAMFDWHGARMLADDQKEVVDAFWGLSPRQALQLMGTEAGRQVFGHDIWVKHVKRKMLSYPEQRDWVITDVRFPDEAQAIRDWGGVLWRVDRPGLVGGDVHASETSMDGYEGWDEVIVNDGTIAELRAKVSRLL
jgi:hypothetical protein